MKRYLKIVLSLLLAIGLSFCASSQRIQSKFPQEIATAYYQKWVGGREETGNGIHFYIEFKKPLAATIRLRKIYFNNQEAVYEQLESNTYVAQFYNRTRNPDLIMDRDSLKEYGNEAPVIKRPRFTLKPNEAMLEYKKNGKIQFFKITNPKEKPMIAYPAMNKPKN